MRHVHLGFHFYGAGNCGDDLMLHGFLDTVRACGTEIRFTCCTPFDAASQRLRFPEIAWLPYAEAKRREQIAACDAWLGLGGAPFQTDSGTWMFDHLAGELQVLRACGKPAFLLGVGANDAAAVAHPATREFLGAVTHVWTRDARTAGLLEGLVPSGRLGIGGDLAHLAVPMNAAVCAAAEPETLVLVIHAEDAARVDVSVLAEVVLRWPGPVRWFCQERRMLPCSERTLHARLPAAAQVKAVLDVPDYEHGSLGDLTRVFTGRGVCLSCRYHAAIVAARRGWRVAVFPRNLKLEGIAEEMAIECVESLLDVRAVERGLERARAVSAVRLEDAAARARASCEACLGILEALPGALPGPPPME